MMKGRLAAIRAWTDPKGQFSIHRSALKKLVELAGIEPATS